MYHIPLGVLRHTDTSLEASNLAYEETREFGYSKAKHRVHQKDDYAKHQRHNDYGGGLLDKLAARRPNDFFKLALYLGKQAFLCFTFRLVQLIHILWGTQA